MRRFYLLFGLLLIIATTPAIAQDSPATPPVQAPAPAPVVKNGWVFSVWSDGTVKTKGTALAKETQTQLLNWVRDKVDEANAANPEVMVGIDEYDVNETDRKGHLLSAKEAFDKLPGRDAWIARLKQGDVLVTRERVKDGKLMFRSFPICLGGPLEPGDVMDGLLKQPLKLAQAAKADQQLQLAIRPAITSSSTSASSSSPAPPAPAAPPAGTRVVATGDHK
jgi:hypothetical protein